MPDELLERIVMFIVLVGCLALSHVVFIRSAEAAAFSFDGACYADEVSALAAFRSGFPVADSAGVVNLSASSINAAGLVSFTTQYKLHSEASWTESSSTVQLQVCDPALVGNGRLDYLLIYLATACVFLFGFTVGKNQFQDRFGGGAV